MRRTIQLFLFTLSLLTISFTVAIAQEVKTPGYYYNNFDGGQLGQSFTAFGGAALGISPTNLAAGSGYSLSSTGTGVAGGYQFKFIDSGADMNAGQGFEWTMLYKNNGGNTDNSKTIDNNKNAWRYWLFANNTDLGNMQGYYLTQNGSKLEVVLRIEATNTRSLLTFDLNTLGGNNITYAIRVQRINKNGQTFRLFIDPYTESSQNATTLRVEKNGEGDIYNKFNYSGLQASSTTAGRFQFDEMKLYSRKLEILGANDPANGFSSTLYDGQKDAVIYALKFRTRGLFTEIYQIQAEIEQSGWFSFSDLVENPRLFRSKDSYFGNSDDILIDKMQDGVSSFSVGIGYRALEANNFQTQTFHSVGTLDGLLMDAGFLFFKVDIKSEASQKGTFSIKKLAKIGNDNASVNYVNVPAVVGGGTTTPNSPSGKAFDWAGGKSNNWNDRENWKPNEVPGANDLARIGVEGFVTENQPEVSSVTNVGNIQFGKANVETLTLKGDLNVAGSVISPVAVSIQGDGTLAIDGAFLVRPIEPDKVITIAVKNLRVTNLVLNTEDKIPQFSIEAGSTVAVSNAIQTTGGSEAKLEVKGSGTLKLIGATPFNLTSKRNTFSLENGSTVEYAGKEKQEVRTADIVYKNISFTGSGSKLVATGELGVRGNWSSEGGKIDLITNNTDVVFYGDVDQSITHIGDNDGLTFGNVNFTFPNTKTINTGTLTVRGNWSSKDGKVDLRSKNTKVVFDYKDQTIIDSESDSRAGVEFADVSFSGAGTKMIKEGNFAVGIGNYLMMGDDTILEVDKIATLTLKADDKGTASVTAIPENSSIQGQVNVERYILGGDKKMWRTYRMLSSPVYDNRQDFTTEDKPGARTYSFKQFKNAMIVTGAGGAANGFDQTPGNSASAWTYANNAFIPIPKLETNVNIGEGAYLFYRGNREDFGKKITNPFLNPESIVMTMTGVLNQQDVTIPLAFKPKKDGDKIAFSLVGNPYAATLDWNAVKKENVTNVIRIWNPEKRQYATFNGKDGINGGDVYIAAGQSFFVETSGDSPSITFQEAQKYTPKEGIRVSPTMYLAQEGIQLNGKAMMTTANTLVAEQSSKVRVKLKKEGTENSDEALIVLEENGKAELAGDDVLRSGGEVVFLASKSSDNKQLAINYMPSISAVSGVELSVDASTTGNYSLQFALNNIPLNYEVKLKDNYLKTINAVNTNENYPFLINKTVAASFGGDRFELMFSPQVTLPVVISSFEGNKVQEGVLLKWVTASAINHSHFLLQRAGEDQRYEELGNISVSQSGKYDFLDKSPRVGYNYYRLVQVDNDGKSTVGEPIVLNYSLNDQNTNGILVYPTVTNKSFTLKYNGALTSETYELKISEVTGKNIFSKRLQKSVLTFGYQGELPSVSAGVYFVELLDISTGKSLGVSKIIKP